ncbi:MAG: hypothetical protein AAF705_04430, partial [Bacteroidota bacterium]
YDSKELIKLNHAAKNRSTETLDNVVESPLTDKNLYSIMDTLSGRTCELKSIDKDLHLHFANQIYSNSKVDSTAILIKAFEYTFPKKNANSFFHKQVTIRANDTLQIQNHFFNNINFQSQKNYDSIKKRISNIAYHSLEKNLDLPFGKAPVREGYKLEKLEFEDIDNNNIQIVNAKHQYTLVIFSFIGCTPCEIALNRLENDEFGLRNKLNLYYSSFQNNNVAIKKYLEHKKIFQNAFAIESNMIEEFRLPTAPTFVLIDSNGKILKIIEGFDDLVFPTLYKLIKT